jgi:predicted flap endonuclease-1-like 5' DNA nuclease
MSAKRFLQKIKQVFGLSGGGGTETDRPGERRTDVTVERETDAGTATEEAGEDVTAEPATDPDPDVTEAEPAPESEEATDEAETSEPVEDIKGIGPTYSDRLAEAGIETVTDLTDSDPATVADAAQTGRTKASNWIDRAQARQ